jgi:hypothetical protein
MTSMGIITRAMRTTLIEKNEKEIKRKTERGRKL